MKARFVPRVHADAQLRLPSQPAQKIGENGSAKGSPRSRCVTAAEGYIEKLEIDLQYAGRVAR
jgi:hypothetical protein